MMIKFSILLRRRQGTTHEDFVAYHKNNHAPLFISLPEFKENVHKYVQSHSLPENLSGIPVPLYDGITELWFDELSSIGKVFSSKRYMELIRPDEEKFIDLTGCSFLISTENQVI